MRDRKMHLLAYVKTGPTAQLAGAWRHPAADLDDIFRPERYEHLARVLEAVCLDGCFSLIRWASPTSNRPASIPICATAASFPVSIR
jgi:hypothetical protein